MEIIILSNNFIMTQRIYPQVHILKKKTISCSHDIENLYFLLEKINLKLNLLESKINVIEEKVDKIYSLSPSRSSSSNNTSITSTQTEKPLINIYIPPLPDEKNDDIDEFNSICRLPD